MHDAARAMEGYDRPHFEAGAPWHRSTLGNKIILERLSHDILNLLCDVKMPFNFYN